MFCCRCRALTIWLAIKWGTDYCWVIQLRMSCDCIWSLIAGCIAVAVVDYSVVAVVVDYIAVDYNVDIVVAVDTAVGGYKHWAVGKSYDNHYYWDDTQWDCSSSAMAAAVVDNPTNVCTHHLHKGSSLTLSEILSNFLSISNLSNLYKSQTYFNLITFLK